MKGIKLFGLGLGVCIACLGLLASGPAWAFSRSLLESPSESLTLEASDSAWQVAEAAPASDTPQNIILKKNLRSPGTAVALALAPGVALHGCGHFYAGRPWTGAALLVVEAGGLYMAYRGGTDVFSVVDKADLSKFTNYHGESGQLSRGVGLAAGGVMIFLASWLYDITGSPIAAEQANQELQRKTENTSPVVTPRLTPQGFEVVIERRF